MKLQNMMVKVMYNILIFPAGSEIGMEIYNALKFSKTLKVYGGTSVKDHACFFYKNLITGLPYLSDDDFIEKLNLAIEENNIDFVYPAHDSAGLFLTQHADEIKARIVTSPLKTVDICRSKAKTYDYFCDCDFIPKTYESVGDIESYPVFVKPSVGQGSNGATKCNSESQLLARLAEGDEVVICEYLEGTEYTIDCFTDKDGVLRIASLRDRARTKAGISVNSKIIPADEEILRIAEQINSRLVFCGAWFFQMKRNARGEYRMLEISPRIPGTMGLSRNTGVNFPLLTIYTLLGYPVEILRHDYEIEVDRAFINRYKIKQEYSCVYLDLDDTLELKDKVNEWLMLYLYQCVNKGIEIYLLTRHARDIGETLQKHKISPSLFKEIIHITDGREKSQYITRADAIFIDDSFRERLDVKQKCKINVFDLDEVEALLDWTQFGV